MRTVRLAAMATTLAVALALAAEPAVEAWRAPDGALYWRAPGAGVGWEAADVDGDGKPDVAIFRCGERYTRVELDTNRDGKADRVHVFNPDGSLLGLYFPDATGVLREPAPPTPAQQRTLPEIEHGGALFKRALELRLAADAGQTEKSDAAAPGVWPPFERPAGEEVRFDLRLTMIPGTPEDLLKRELQPSDVGRFELSARAGVGRAYRGLAAQIRVDPTEQRKPVTGRLDADLYPVWVLTPDDQGAPAKKLLVQLTGHLTAPDAFDEIFFLTATLDGTRPATLHVPAHDRAGRSRGWLLVEMRAK